MNLYEKMLELQIRIDAFMKDGENKSDKYKYVSSDEVLNTVRPILNELRLLVIPKVKEAHLREGETKSGTTRYLTELFIDYIWIDVESGERLDIESYAQGVDLAGEKGVGKAFTYGEKYHFMKVFHIPTSKDDPDSDGRTRTGEKRERGTQAGRESEAKMREEIKSMLSELCEGNEEAVKQSLKVFTNNKNTGYAGVESLDDVSAAALGAVYAKVKRKYEERKGGGASG